MNGSQTVGIAGRGVAGLRRTLGSIVIGGVVWFVAAIAILHLLRPDVDALARVTSEYAVGPYGALMMSAYIVFAISLASLGVGLAGTFPRRGAAGAGIGLLLLAAVGVGTAAFFPVDVGASTPVTATGWVHRFAAIVAFASMATAALVLARPFRRHPDWHAVARLGVVTGVVGLLGFAAIQLFLLERGLGGAAQRLVLVLVVAWMVAAARRLR